MYIYLYDSKSETGLALAKALGLKIIKHVDSKFKGDHTKKVLNWGCSDLPLQVRRADVLNKEHNVDWAVNKIKAFSRMQEFGVRTVPWTTDIAVARQWMAEGARIFGRTKVKGKDGEGLIECRRDIILDGVKLWTKFIPAVKEYRVNIVRTYDEEFKEWSYNCVCQRKAPLDGYVGELNPDIKTSGNGYGFKFVTQNIPRDVIWQAQAAIDAIGLDFGGVDVLWDGEHAWVLEVNTAPQFTPRVIETLKPAFKRMLGMDE